MRDDEYTAKAAAQPDAADELRRAALEAGRHLQAVPNPEDIEGRAGEELSGHALSVAAAARRRGAELLKCVHSTPLAMKGAEARGQADGRRAQRLTAERRATLAGACDDARAEVRALERQLDDVEEQLDEALQEAPARPDGLWAALRHRVRGSLTGAARRSTFEVVPITRKALLIAAPLEIAATTALIEGPISNLVATSSAIGSYLIAAAVSASFLGLGLVAGFAAAALRLSGPVAAATIVGLSAALLGGLGPALDLIRMGDERGVTILTGATLATVLIAAVTAYATAVHKELSARQAGERERLGDLGARLALDHPAMGLLRKRDRLERRLDGARARLARARAELGLLDAEIERLRRSSEETAIRVVEAEKAGIEAQVDLSSLAATTAASVARERRAAMARMAVDAARTPAPAGLRPEQQAALGVLGAGLVAGLLLSSALVALAGGTVAAALWLLGAWPQARTRSHREHRPSDQKG